MVLYVVQELAGLAEWHAPRAGMFLWIKLLQPPQNESTLVAALRDHKVVVVPGAPQYSPALDGFALDTRLVISADASHPRASPSF